MVQGVAPTTGVAGRGPGNVYGAPRSGGSRAHSGVDISTGQYGGDVVAMVPGIVAYVGFNDGYGGNVIVVSSDGVATRYAMHNTLDTMAVEVGDVVNAGDKLGIIGDTSKSYKAQPHLHLETITDPAIVAKIVANADTNTFTSTSNKKGTTDPFTYMGLPANIALTAGESLTAALAALGPVPSYARGDFSAVSPTDGVISHISANPTATETGQLTAIANALSGKLGQPIGDIGSLADSAIAGMAISGLPGAFLGGDSIAPATPSSDGAYAVPASVPGNLGVNTFGSTPIGSLPAASVANAPVALAPSGNAPYGAEGIVAAALAGDKNGLSAALAAVAKNAADSLSLGQKLGMLADSSKRSAFEAKVTSDVASYLNGQDAAVLGKIAQNVQSDPGLLSALPAAMQTQVATALAAFTPNVTAASSLAAAKNAEGTAKALAALSAPTPVSTPTGMNFGAAYGPSSSGAYGISPSTSGATYGPGGSLGIGTSIGSPGLASGIGPATSTTSSSQGASYGSGGSLGIGTVGSGGGLASGIGPVGVSAPSASKPVSSLGPTTYSAPVTGSSASSQAAAQAMSSPAAMAALSGLTSNNGITTATPATMASLSQAATTLGDVGDLTGFIAPAAVVAPAAKTTTAKAVPAAKSKTSTTVAAKTKTPAQSLYGQAVANSVANGYGTPASFGPGTMYGVSPSGQPYSSIGNAYGGTTTSWGTSGGGTATAVGYASQRGGDQGQAVPAAVASGSSAGAKVLCTHYKDKGWLPRDIWAADIRYSLMAPMDMRIGYLSWAMPLVDYLKTGTRTARIAERILWPVVRAWSQEMAHRGDPRFEGSFWGRIVLHTFGSVCLVIGRNIRRKWIGETVNG